MIHRVIFSLLCLLPLTMAAQKNVVIYDLENKVPIRQARVRVDGVRTFTTPYTGQIVLPEKFDSIIVSHPKYLQTTLKHDAVTDSIGLIPKTHTLGEVEIVAEDLAKRLQKNVEDWGLTDKTERQLVSPKTSLAEFDFVQIFDFKGKARRKRTRKVKKALSEMDNDEKDPVIRAYKETVKGTPDEDKSEGVTTK